ncbi:hypothetical protein HRbin06_00076 [archaeon HR06]|nr:hypothetical protein HRbin06_00076 [archaeon HR06]
MIFSREKSLKLRISNLIKDLEFRRLELSNLLSRLELRRKNLFDAFLRSIERGDGEKALVYSSEYEELRKVLDLINKSLLMVIQMKLRLETLIDMGDFLYQMELTCKNFKDIMPKISFEDLLADIKKAVIEIQSYSSFNKSYSSLEEISEEEKITIYGSSNSSFREEKIPLLAIGNEDEGDFKPKLLKTVKEGMEK